MLSALLGRRALYLLAGALGVACCAWLFASRVERAREHGRQEVQAEAAIRVAAYQVAMMRAERALKEAQGRTDTVYRIVAGRAGSVQKTANRIHDTVRVAFPVVDTLVRESVALAHAVDTLLQVVQTERVAAAEVHMIDTTTIRAQAVIIGAQADTIVTLRKRPTRKLAGVIAFVVGGIGYLVGRQ